MIKTFKKKNNSSIHKKKISVRNKYKTNRRFISKIQRIKTRKQKGGVIDWISLEDVEELDLNAVLSEYIVTENIAVHGLSSNDLLLYKIPQGELEQLSRTLNKNKKLIKIKLHDAVFTSKEYDFITYVNHDPRLDQEFSNEMLRILFGFKCDNRRIEIDLNLPSVKLGRKFRGDNGSNYDGKQFCVFNTDVLSIFFTRNTYCTISRLNLLGWKFNAAGLYNLAVLELLGYIDENASNISESVAYHEYFSDRKSQININYVTIKNKFKEGMLKKQETVLLSTHRKLERTFDPLIPSIVGIDLNLERTITVDDILSLCTDVSYKIIIIIRLLLKNYSNAIYPYNGQYSLQPGEHKGGEIPMELISVLFMSKKTPEELKLFNKWFHIISSNMMNYKLQRLYGDRFNQLTQEKKARISSFIKNILDSYLRMPNKRIAPIESNLNYRNDLIYLDQLMKRNDLDTLKIIYPEITLQDIEEYNRSEGDIREYLYTPAS